MESSLRVYRAMLELDQKQGFFMQRELARDAAVKNATVNTIVLRQGRFLEKIGHEETGQRGGQARRYRLTDDGRRHLENLLGLGSDEADTHAFEGAAAARAAIDLLLRDPPASPGAQKHLVALAQQYWGRAGAQPSEVQGTFDVLLAICRAELGVASEPPALGQVDRLAANLSARDERERADRLVSRVAQFVHGARRAANPRPVANGRGSSSRPTTASSRPRVLATRRRRGDGGSLSRWLS